MAGMTKTQLVRHMAEKTGTTNKVAGPFLEHLADTAITVGAGLFLLDLLRKRNVS